MWLSQGYSWEQECHKVRGTMCHRLWQMQAGKTPGKLTPEAGEEHSCKFRESAPERDTLNRTMCSVPSDPRAWNRGSQGSSHRRSALRSAFASNETNTVRAKSSFPFFSISFPKCAARGLQSWLFASQKLTRRGKKKEQNGYKICRSTKINKAGRSLVYPEEANPQVVQKWQRARVREGFIFSTASLRLNAVLTLKDLSCPRCFYSLFTSLRISDAV